MNVQKYQGKLEKQSNIQKTFSSFSTDLDAISCCFSFRMQIVLECSELGSRAVFSIHNSNFFLV